MLERQVVEGVSDDASIVHRKRSHERDLSNQKDRIYQERATKDTVSNVKSDPPKQTDSVKVTTPLTEKAPSSPFSKSNHLQKCYGRPNRLGSAAAPPAQNEP